MQCILGNFGFIYLLCWQLIMIMTQESNVNHRAKESSFKNLFPGMCAGVHVRVSAMHCGIFFIVFFLHDINLKNDYNAVIQESNMNHIASSSSCCLSSQKKVHFKGSEVHCGKFWMMFYVFFLFHILLEMHNSDLWFMIEMWISSQKKAGLKCKRVHFGSAQGIVGNFRWLCVFFF